MLASDQPGESIHPLLHCTRKDLIELLQDRDARIAQLEKEAARAKIIEAQNTQLRELLQQNGITLPPDVATPPPEEPSTSEGALEGAPSSSEQCNHIKPSPTLKKNRKR
jgi:hypothetical protein